MLLPGRIGADGTCAVAFQWPTTIWTRSRSSRARTWPTARLHRAAPRRARPGGQHEDYYAVIFYREGECGQRQRTTASRRLVDAAARAWRIALLRAGGGPGAHGGRHGSWTFQSLNLGERQGSRRALERWGREQTPAGCGLSWWETAAAGGSSLGVHVLIGLAADPRLDPLEPAAVERAYFPWIGALHSLLDSVVDVAEDRREPNATSSATTTRGRSPSERMVAIARRARAEARALARGPATS